MTTTRGARIFLTLLTLFAVLGLLVSDTSLYPYVEALILIALVLIPLTSGSLDDRLRAASYSLVVYVVIKYGLMTILRPAHYLDFIQAYKAYILMVPLLYIAGKRVFSISALERFWKFYLIVGAGHYIYTYLTVPLSDPRARWGLLAENNYELLFLIGLTYLVVSKSHRVPLLWMMILGVIVWTSGSRSAGAEYILLLLFLYGRSRSRAKIFGGALGAILGYVMWLRAIERLHGQGLETLDRVRFLNVFLEEINSFSFGNFFFGSAPLTPLSASSCSSLTYYQSLFSHSGDGQCYAVIFHSYLLRNMIDHGLVGIALIAGILWYALRVGGHSLRDRFFYMSLFLLNALSVASINSTLGLLLIMIILGAGGRKSYSRHPTASDKSSHNPKGSGLISTLGMPSVQKGL